jgi:hypothetical protein
MRVTGASSRMIQDILTLLNDGQREHYGDALRDVLGCYDDRRNPVAQTVIMFGEMHALEQGEQDPTGKGLEIPEMSIGDLYPLYQSRIGEGLGVELGVTEPASLGYFKKVFKRQFDGVIKPNRRLNKFTKCSYCGCCKLELTKYPPGTEVHRKINARYLRHLSWAAQNRSKYRHHIAKAKMNPKM